MGTDTFANIYQWTDSSGNVHFSDTPHKGATEIKLPQVQTYTPKKNNKNDKKSAEPLVTDNLYDSITITQPENDSTLPNLEGNVTVTAEILPKLFENDKVQLLLDGKPIGEPQGSAAFSLTNILRGKHQVIVQIINQTGDVIIASDPVTFNVRRPIIQKNLPTNK